MKIPEVTVFAYATKGEALEIANQVVGKEVCVASVRITRGFKPAEADVAYLVLPNGFENFDGSAS